MHATPDGPVILVVPAEPSFLRLVRLVVSALAADLGFDFEQVEDLRIAADELVSVLIGATFASSPVSVTLTTDGDVLSLAAIAAAGEETTADLDPLASQIVEAVVESFTVQVTADVVSVGFRSRSPGGAARVA